MKALDKLLGGQQNLIGIVLLALLVLEICRQKRACVDTGKAQ